jgi:small subunit ribosomal protein S17e
LGRVRPNYIKRISRKLVERFPEKFTKDFERNKELVDALTNINSKKVRNRVAGYTAHLVTSDNVN